MNNYMFQFCYIFKINFMCHDWINYFLVVSVGVCDHSIHICHIMPKSKEFVDTSDSESDSNEKVQCCVLYVYDVIFYIIL